MTSAGLGIVGGAISGSFSPLIANLFPTRTRFSGIAITYNMSFAVFGGLAPLASQMLIARSGSPAMPALYFCGAAVLALVVIAGTRSAARP